MKETHRPGGEFELQVIPRNPDHYGLALVQRNGHDNEDGGSEDVVVRIWGDPLRSVMDQVLAALKRSGYRTTDLNRSRRAPFRIGEEDAVRLGLLFLALKPLRKQRRLEELAARVRAMEPEEAYYWFSKTTSEDKGPRAQRAMRILLSEE